MCIRDSYWTDRGDPPRGNTVNRAPMDPVQGNGKKEPAIIFDHLMEGIGIALDPVSYTHLDVYKRQSRAR